MKIRIKSCLSLFGIVILNKCCILVQTEKLERENLKHRLRQYKRRAKELLCSEKGLKHRGQRCIESEAVFGQIKNNMNYKRFRHFGKDKVFQDFAFLAIAFNIKKMCAKLTKKGMNWLIRLFYELTTAVFRCWEHINQRNLEKIAA